MCSCFNTIPVCDRQRDGQTDERTDGIAVASTALAMRALRRAVKMELAGKTVYGSVFKTTQLSASAQNQASPKRCRKSFTIIFLGDHDMPLTGSNFGNLTAFRAILAIFSMRMRSENMAKNCPKCCQIAKI